jgi:GNAT superfamily N-acetyltransferase
VSIVKIKENRETDQVPSVTTRALAESQAVSIGVVRTVEEIEEIRDVWRTFQQHPNADIDFYLTVCRLRPEIRRPHVIVLHRQGRPEAMLVGRIVQGTIDLGVGYGKILRMPARLLTVVYGGLMGDLSLENGKVLVAEVRNALRRHEADAALFNFVRTDSPLYPSILNSPARAQRDYFPIVQPHWSVKFPARAEDLGTCISSHERAQIRRRTKLLEKDYSGGVRIEKFASGADIERMCLDIEEVARKTYQRGLGVGFFDDVETRDRLQFEAKKGWLRAYVLYIADKPRAFWMGNLYGAVYYSGDVGYDPAYKKYGLGKQLLIKVLEDLCRNGGQEMDFGLGDAEWKQAFEGQSWQEASAYIFAPSLAATAINFVRTPTILADRILRRALTRTKLTERIKKIWRSKLRQE